MMLIDRSDPLVLIDIADALYFEMQPQSLLFFALNGVDLVLQHSKVGGSCYPLIQGSLDVGGFLVGPAYFCPVDISFVALIRNQEVPLSEPEVGSSLDRVLLVLFLEEQYLIVVQGKQESVDVPVLVLFLIFGEHYAGVAAEVLALVGLHVEDDWSPDVDGVQSLGQELVFGGLEPQFEIAFEGQDGLDFDLPLVDGVFLQFLIGDGVYIYRHLQFVDHLQHCLLLLVDQIFDIFVDVVGVVFLVLVEEGDEILLHPEKSLDLQETGSTVSTVYYRKKSPLHLLKQPLQLLQDT